MNSDPFPIIPALLNPKFNSYKLAPLPHAPSSTPIPPPGATLPAAPDYARYSFAEVQDRARHNHLTAGLDEEFVFVDKEGGVIAFEVDQHGNVHYQPLVTLPMPISTTPSTSRSPSPEYPAALPVTKSLWSISDGHGRLYLVSVRKPPSTTNTTSTITPPPKWTSTILSSFEFTSSEGLITPFRLHSVNLTSSTSPRVIALLSQTIKVTPSSRPASTPGPGASSAAGGGIFRTKLESTTAFEWISVDLGELAELEQASDGEASEVVKEWKKRWSVRSSELPRYVKWDARTEEYLIGSAVAPKEAVSSTAQEARETPVTSSTATTSSTNTISNPFVPAGAASATTVKPSESPAAPNQPPYSWTQDKESVTIAFAIPSTTPTSSIRLTFSPHFLTLHIASPASLLSNPSSSSDADSTTPPLPHLSHVKLWAPIDHHSSLWTFDRDAEGRDSSFGLLSLHLEKQHAGTRWSHVFAEGQEESGIREVGETLDGDQLGEIVEKLEKYTEGGKVEEGEDTIEMVGVDGRTTGEVPWDEGGVPTSLRGDEMDVELDGDVGTPFVVSRIGRDGKVTSAHKAFERSLLSSPLPFAGSERGEGGIVLKHDVDGVVFDPPSGDDDHKWTHTSTFPALAFVLASKTTAKYIYHTTSFVLAFDAPSTLLGNAVAPEGGSGGGGNLFVYYKPEGEQGRNGATTAKQSVVRLVGTGGNVLGVCGVRTREGKEKVVVLFEREVGVYELN